MAKVKRKLEEILQSMTLEQRIQYLMYVCGYSSEDARDYAECFE